MFLIPKTCISMYLVDYTRLLPRIPLLGRSFGFHLFSVLFILTCFQVSTTFHNSYIQNLKYTFSDIQLTQTQ
jgi:hypothetical protein